MKKFVKIQIISISLYFVSTIFILTQSPQMIDDFLILLFRSLIIGLVFILFFCAMKWNISNKLLFVIGYLVSFINLYFNMIKEDLPKFLLWIVSPYDIAELLVIILLPFLIGTMFFMPIMYMFVKYLFSKYNFKNLNSLS